MSPDLAIAVIRDTLERETTSRTVRRSVRRNRMIVSNDTSGPAPTDDAQPACVVCCWILIKTPASGRQILLKEAKGLVLAHLANGTRMDFPSQLPSGAVTSQMTSIAQAHVNGTGMQENAESAMNFAPGPRAKAVDGLHAKLDEAWRAGAWDAACGTRHGFAIGLDDMIAAVGRGGAGGRRSRLAPAHAQHLHAEGLSSGSGEPAGEADAAVPRPDAGLSGRCRPGAGLARISGLDHDVVSPVQVGRWIAPNLASGEPSAAAGARSALLGLVLPLEGPLALLGAGRGRPTGRSRPPSSPGSTSGAAAQAGRGASRGRGMGERCHPSVTATWERGPSDRLQQICFRKPLASNPPEIESPVI